MRYNKYDFSAGEISPRLNGSFELPQYKAGCKSLKNMIPLSTGGAINRPGTEYITAVKSVGTHWVVRGFVFASDDAYVLEIGEYYIRFIKNDVQVVTGGTTPYEVVTPWASIHVKDLKFTQSADQIWITHISYRPMILTRYADTNWTLEYYNYLNGPYTLENATTTTVTAAATAISTSKNITGVTKANPGVVSSASHGFADGDVIFIEGILGMTELNSLPFKVRNKTTDTFELDYNNSGASLNTSTYTAYSSGGTAKKATTLTASTSIFSNVAGEQHSKGRTLWEVRHWIQTVAEETYILYDPVTGDSIKCGGTWRLKTHGAWNGTLSVQVSDDGGGTWTTSRVYSSKKDVNFDSSVTETFSDNFLVRVQASGMTPWVSGDYCLAVLTADPFEWVGVARIIQVPAGGGGSSTNYTTADILVESTLGTIFATSVWSEGAWSEKRGYPACSSFFNDRLCFSGSLMEPNTIWFSQAGNYYDFGRSFPLADSDGITVNANSREMNRIYNMVDVNRLVEFTSAGVFSTEPGPNGLLTPTSIVNKANDLAGSSNASPVIVNDRAIYFQTFNRILRDTAYSLETDGFTGINLTQFSDHFFKTYTGVEMAYQKEPWQTVWIVRSDGKLISLTYTKQAEIYGWAEHGTCAGTYNCNAFESLDEWKRGGEFKSVCCIPGSEIDDVYLVVKRSFDDSGLAYGHYIEKFTNRNATSDPQKQVFLDCSFNIDIPVAATLISRTVSTDNIMITSASHGLGALDQVEIFDLLGTNYVHKWSELNGNRYSLTDVTTHTFKLVGTSTLFADETFSDVITGSFKKVFASFAFPSGYPGIIPTMWVLANGYSDKWVDDPTISGEGSVAYPSAGCYTSPSSPIVNASTGLAIKATSVVVGLPFLSECEVTNIDFETTAGSTQQKLKTISDASVGLYETYGGKIGTDRNEMYALTDNDGTELQHALTSGQPTGTPPDLFSGIFKQSMVSGSANPLSIIIRQEEPYPITITNINANVEVEE